jgi:hypothetical protein
MQPKAEQLKKLLCEYAHALSLAMGGQPADPSLAAA